MIVLTNRFHDVQRGIESYKFILLANIFEIDYTWVDCENADII